VLVLLLTIFQKMMFNESEVYTQETLPMSSFSESAASLEPSTFKDTSKELEGFDLTQDSDGSLSSEVVRILSAPEDPLSPIVRTARKRPLESPEPSPSNWAKVYPSGSERISTPSSVSPLTPRRLCPLPLSPTQVPLSGTSREFSSPEVLTQASDLGLLESSGFGEKPDREKAVRLMASRIPNRYTPSSQEAETIHGGMDTKGSQMSSLTTTDVISVNSTSSSNGAIGECEHVFIWDDEIGKWACQYCHVEDDECPYVDEESTTFFPFTCQFCEAKHSCRFCQALECFADWNVFNTGFVVDVREESKRASEVASRVTLELTRVGPFIPFVEDAQLDVCDVGIVGWGSFRPEINPLNRHATAPSTLRDGRIVKCPFTGLIFVSNGHLQLFWYFLCRESPDILEDLVDAFKLKGPAFRRLRVLMDLTEILINN